MNRRMRTRMSGGVRGGAGDCSLYSIVDQIVLSLNSRAAGTS